MHPLQLDSFSLYLCLLLIITPPVCSLTPTFLSCVLPDLPYFSTTPSSPFSFLASHVSHTFAELFFSHMLSTLILSACIASSLPSVSFLLFTLLGFFLWSFFFSFLPSFRFHSVASALFPLTPTPFLHFALSSPLCCLPRFILLFLLFSSLCSLCTFLILISLHSAFLSCACSMMHLFFFQSPDSLSYVCFYYIFNDFFLIYFFFTSVDSCLPAPNHRDTIASFFTASLQPS